LSLVFLNVNTSTNAVNYASYGNPNHLADHNAFITLVDDTDNGVKDLLLNPSSHSFLDVIGSKPYMSASYDGSNVIITLNNTNTSPTEANISIIGVVYQFPITNNQIAIPITVHPLLQTQRITVTSIVDGFPYTAIEVGGTGSSVETQVYKDINGLLQVVPVKSADLALYWQNSLVDMSFSNVDLATADEIAIGVLFNKVIPTLNLTLTSEEEAAISEIQNNLLPSFSTTLANLANGNLHYNSYKLHSQQAKTAMDKYVADKIEISKYVELK
jgi:hypothetical protein